MSDRLKRRGVLIGITGLVALAVWFGAYAGHVVP